MDDLKNQTLQLKQEVANAVKRLNLSSLEAESKELQRQSEESDFWSDNQKAQEVMKRQSQLQSRLGPWQRLQTQIGEISELSNLDDVSLRDDLQKQLAAAQTEFGALKSELKFSGEFDAKNAILSIHAGAGGTDAQDWAQMLMRMYIRWAEKFNYEVKVIDESPGEEAGIKSATLELAGNFAYGKLKSEHGVHRLVRLSPYNSDNLRQTSFAKVEVLPEIDRPNEVKIDDKDLKIDVYRSGGHGGQSVNTTDSAVRVTHIPTGISVAIQNERSQLQNKETALTILRSRLAQLQLEQHQVKISDLKGPNEQAAWGNQIRNYVLHPYKQVKDLRSGYESKEPDKVLDGDIGAFIDAYLEHTLQA